MAEKKYEPFLVWITTDQNMNGEYDTYVSPEALKRFDATGVCICDGFEVDEEIAIEMARAARCEQGRVPFHAISPVEQTIEKGVARAMFAAALAAIKAEASRG